MATTSIASRAPVVFHHDTLSVAIPPVRATNDRPFVAVVVKSTSPTRPSESSPSCCETCDKEMSSNDKCACTGFLIGALIVVACICLVIVGVIKDKNAQQQHDEQAWVQGIVVDYSFVLDSSRFYHSFIMVQWKNQNCTVEDMNCDAQLAAQWQAEKCVQADYSKSQSVTMLSLSLASVPQPPGNSTVTQTCQLDTGVTMAWKGMYAGGGAGIGAGLYMILLTFSASQED